jgi:hypothetical protein
MFEKLKLCAYLMNSVRTKRKSGVNYQFEKSLNGTTPEK